jgi:type I restriction enzyme, S subunit
VITMVQHVAEDSAIYEVARKLVQRQTTIVRLGDAVEINPRPSVGAIADDLEVSFVPMAAVEANTGRLDASAVRPYGAVKKGYTTFCEGDVLFAKITPCMENGKMAVARNLRNKVGCGSTEFHVLRPRVGVDAAYVYYFVSSTRFRSEAVHHMTGAVGQKRVPKSFLTQVEIPLPDLGIQRSIVAEIKKHFSRVDDSVSNLKRIKENLDRYKRSVLKAAVDGTLISATAETSGPPRQTSESGVALLKRIVAGQSAKSMEKNAPLASAALEKLPSLPHGWTWATYGQVGQLHLGRQRSPKYHAGPNMRPYLRVQNVFEDRIDISDVMEMDFPPSDFEKYRLFPGDLLLNEGQSPELLGRPAIYRGEVPDACFTNTLIRFRAVKGVSVDWALHVTRHHMLSGRFVDEGSITTNIAHLSLGRLSGVEFPLPPTSEQLRIVAEVERILSLMRVVEREVDRNLKRTEKLRQAILDRQFSWPHTVEANL